MLTQWIAYSRDGEVLATIDYLAARDENGDVVGLIDFEAHEKAGGRMRDIADHQDLDVPIPDGIFQQVAGRKRQEPGESLVLPPDHPFRLAHDRCAGATTWPEWLSDYSAFRLELDDRKRAARLVHKKSGHRRERAAIEAAIAERINEKRREAERGGAARRAELKRLKVSQSVIDEAVDPSPEPADLRDLVGGPTRPLLLDENGKTMPRPKVERPDLPMLARERAF